MQSTREADCDAVNEVVMSGTGSCQITSQDTMLCKDFDARC